MGDTRRRFVIGASLNTAAIALFAQSTAIGQPICLPASEASAVHEDSYVQIGGTPQWLQLRGADRRNPVLLILHGGPGSTWDPFVEFFAPWEKRFTIAYWSQRGAGRSFRQTGPEIAPTMTIERMANDGLEVAEFIRQRLGAPAIILLAHSWGTVLGITMAQKRPDLFAAYIGTGQVVSGTEGERTGYREVLSRARAVGNTSALKDLGDIGEPPYRDIQHMVLERRWAGAFDTPSDAAFDKAWRNPSDFSAADAAERNRAWLFSNYLMYGDKRQDGPFMQIDFAKTARRFSIPMIFIQGETDHITPTSLARTYERSIRAPRKAFVSLPGGGHNAVFAMRDAFFNAMVQKLGNIVSKCG